MMEKEVRPARARVRRRRVKPLVTARMLRELFAARQRFEARIDGEDDVPEFLERFDAMVVQMPVTMWIAFR